MTAYYICALITVASAFIGLGFSLAAVQKAYGDDRVNALYGSARSVALAALSLVPFCLHSEQLLTAIAGAMIAVQAIDAGIGVQLARPVKIFGPALIAVFNLWALLWVLTT